MNHIYFSLMVGKEKLSPGNKFYRFQSDGQEYLIPIFHIESDDKEVIREEVIKSIDSMLKYI